MNYREIVKTIETLLKDKDQVIVAIDGMCGSGKSTLGEKLHIECGGLLLHMDDFYLQTYQRTSERLAEAGGNVDYERFKEEVLDPILEHKDFLYRPFDCQTMTLTEGKALSLERLIIIEGSYSHHPYFGDSYDLRLFIHISDELQAERLLKREGAERYQNFVALWIPKENAYFNHYQIAQKACVIEGDDSLWNN